MAKMMLRNRKGRKSNSSKTPCNESSNESDNCVICLDTVDCRGKLGVCEHWFCFPCIFEWSKNTNTCPVCKKKFRCITKTHLKQGKSPVQQVRVGDVDQRVWNDDDEFDILSVLDSDDDDSVYNDVDTSDYDESSSFVNVFMTIHECYDDSFLIDGSDSESSSDDDLDDSSQTSDPFSEDSSSNLDSSSLSESTDDWSPKGNLTPIPKKKIKVAQKSVTVDSSDSDKDMEWDEHEPLCDRWKRLTGNGAVEAPFRHRSTTEKSSTGSRNSQPTSSGQNSQETSKRGESSRKKEKQKKTPSTSAKKNTRKSKTSRQSGSTACTSGQWLDARTRRAESRANRQPTPVKPKPRGRATEHSTASTSGQWLDARTRRAESRTNRQPTPVKPKPRGRATEDSTVSTAGQWLDARTRRAESRANRQPTPVKPKPRGRATEDSTACTSGQWLDTRTRCRGESSSNRQPTLEKPKRSGKLTKHRSAAEQWLNARTPRAESRDKDSTKKRDHYSTHTRTNESMSSKNVMATSSNEPSMSQCRVLPKKRTAKSPVQPVDSDSETSDEVLIPSKRRSVKRFLSDIGSDESPREKKTREKNTKYKTGRRVLRERQNNPDED